MAAIAPQRSQQQRQVRVARAAPDAVHRCVQPGGAVAQRRQRIRQRLAGVVVAVKPDLKFYLGAAAAEEDVSDLAD